MVFYAPVSVYECHTLYMCVFVWREVFEYFSVDYDYAQ